MTLVRSAACLEVIDVEVPFAVSDARIGARWKQSYLQALAGVDALVGRWVLSGYARSVYAGLDGRSLPEISVD